MIKIKKLSKKYFEGCISGELFHEYIEGRTSSSKTIAIEMHVNSCQNCYNELASLLRNSICPATEAEKNEISRLRTLSAQEQVNKIIEYHKRLNKKVQVEPEKVKGSTIKANIRELINGFVPVICKPKIAFASLFITFCFIGTFLGYRYYNKIYQVNFVEKFLLKKHKTHIEDVRLSGGYQPTAISKLLAAEIESSYDMKFLKDKLCKDKEYSSKSVKAQHLLAKLYIIEGKLDKATQLLDDIKTKSNEPAKLWNDIGVVYYKKKAWENAEEYFKSAISFNENLLEAHFNLGLVKIKLGEPDEALSYLEKYIEIENDDAWIRAALNLIDKIYTYKE